MEQLILFAAAGAGGLGDIARSTAQQFGLNWGLFTAQLISVSVCMALLHRFAYKPILRTLEERRQRIAEGLANADRIKEELAKTEEARQEIMAKANTEATQLIEQARELAAKVQEKESQRAVVAAEQIVAKAREAMAADREQMFIELRNEVGRLVVETTAKVSGKVLTTEDQQRLISDANKELAA